MASTFIDLIANIKGKVSSSFKKAKKDVDELKQNVDGVNDTPISPKVDKKSLNKIAELKKGFTDLKEKGIDDLKDSIPGLNSGFAKMVMGINPVLAGIVAIGAGAIATAMHFSDVAKEYGQLRDKYLSITGDINDATQSASLAKSISDTLGVEQDELLKSAKVLSKEYGITTTQALGKLRDGIIATNGELGKNLDWVNEYASKFKESGASVEDFFVTVDKSMSEGAFNDKILDFFKEAGNKIQEMSDTTKEALIKSGVDVLSYQKKIASGEMSRYDATKEIYKQIQLQTDEQAKQNALVALGASALEDGSRRALDAVIDYKGTQEDILANGTEYQKNLLKQVNTQEQINKREQQFSQSFANFGKYFSDLWMNIKLNIYDFLTKIQPILDYMIEFLVDIWNFIAPIVEILGKLAWFVIKIGAILSVVLYPAIAIMLVALKLLGDFLGWIGKLIDTYVIPIVDWLNEKLNLLIETMAKFFKMDKKGEVQLTTNEEQNQRSKEATAPKALTPEQVASNLALMDANKDSDKTGKKTNDSLTASNTASRTVAETKSISFNIGNVIKIDELQTTQDMQNFQLMLQRFFEDAVNKAQLG